MNTKYFYLILPAFIFMVSCKKHETPGPKKSSGNVSDTVVAKKVDVYIAGVSSDVYPLINKASYWKNGVQVPLTNGLPSSAGPIAIQDTDVYILGSITTNGALQTVYWKNGVPVNIDSVVGTGIAVSGKNIYISGVITTAANLTIPVVWKNGVITHLANPSTLGQANAIALSGNDVYVAAC
jgi:hypothetical protein